MTPLHQAYLLKGWLLGREVPAEVTAAVEAIIGVLGAEGVRLEIKPMPIASIPLHPESDTEQCGDPVTQQGEIPADHEPNPVTEPEQPKPRKKRELTPAAHAAMLDRLAKARAARQQKRASEPEPPPAFSEPELRITVHTPPRKSNLTDDDWPEIKEMLAAGRTRASVASDYDEEPEVLDSFISFCQRREGKSPGEAPASPSDGTSGAARQTW